MSNNFIFGLAIDGTFYSNRMKFPTSIENGIYAVDMDQDDFKASMVPADIDEAIKFFRKASRIKVVRGISFQDGIIPENPVAYRTLPLRVKDATYDVLEEVEVAIPQDGPAYFMRIISTEKAFPLLEVRNALENKTDINLIKGVTPEMRIVYTFHYLEMERERIQKEIEEKQKKIEETREKLKKEMENPTNFIKHSMESSGAIVHSVKKVNRGFEIVWSAVGYTINTLVNFSFRVIEAGFCTSGHDNTQSVGSVGKLLRDYVQQHDGIHITRSRGGF